MTSSFCSVDGNDRSSYRQPVARVHAVIEPGERHSPTETVGDERPRASLGRDSRVGDSSYPSSLGKALPIARGVVQLVVMSKRRCRWPAIPSARCTLRSNVRDASCRPDSAGDLNPGASSPRDADGMAESISGPRDARWDVDHPTLSAGHAAISARTANRRSYVSPDDSPRHRLRPSQAGISRRTSGSHSARTASAGSLPFGRAPDLGASSPARSG